MLNVIWKLLTGRSSFLRGVRATVGAQVLMIAINAFTGVAAARLLGPGGRGALAVATLWTFTLVYLGSCGINQSIVYFTGKNRTQVPEILGATLVIGCIQSVIVIGVGIFVLHFALKHYTLEVQRLAILFLLAAPLIMIGGYPGNILQGLLKYKSFNAIRLLPAVFYAAGLAVLWIAKDHQLSHVLFAQILGLFAAFMGGWWILSRYTPLKSAWSPELSRALAWFGAKTELGNIGTFINKSSDQLILSLFVPPRELGLYVVAVTVSSAIVFLPQAVGIATLAEASNQDRSASIRTIGHAMRMSLLWLGSAALLLIFAAPFLITRLFGPGFAGATLACQILLPGAVAWGLNQVLYEGAFALGYPILPSYAELLGTIVTIVGLVVLLPRLGFLGAAIVSTFAYSTSCVLMLGFYTTKMQVDARQFFKFPWASSRIREHAQLETS